MKILLIHNKYTKYSGEEAVVNSQIKLLRRNGHAVSTYFRSSEEIEFMSNGKIKVFFSAIFNPRSIKEIKDIIRKEEPDIVHIHNLYPLISPSILPVIKKMGIPIVITVHNYRLLCANGLFFNNGEICEKCTGTGKELNCITNNCESSIFKSTGYALRNFWARKNKYYIDCVDIFLCLTEFQKNKLISNGFSSDKCRVIPNFYDKEILETGNDIPGGNYVAFAGRISPEKGIPLLLEAALILPNIPFQLAGEIRNGYANELNIPNNVTLRGMLNSDELSNFYRNAYCLVLPSICYEGFPMVFPEAMAHKLPIIAPNMAGYPEIAVDNNNGLLFEPSNVESLSNTIVKLWNDGELSLKLGVNGFEKVKKKYSAPVYTKLLENVYSQILK
jgi:glycosyltransferase involved in cell wall biosynthesis